MGAFAGMSAARAALVSAAIDTVASKNLFIGSNPPSPAESGCLLAMLLFVPRHLIG
jgi:hypothetical protein